MDGPRHIWWNFVSSRKERIEQAKADWKLGRFDSVPGDEANSFRCRTAHDPEKLPDFSDEIMRNA